MTERFSSVDDAPDDVRAFLEASRPAGRGAPGTIRALAHRPEMLRTVLAWARVLAREGALARRDHDYVLTVNLTDPAAGMRVPGVVDGVRVVTAVIGAVRPL